MNADLLKSYIRRVATGTVHPWYYEHRHWGVTFMSLTPEDREFHLMNLLDHLICSGKLEIDGPFVRDTCSAVDASGPPREYEYSAIWLRNLFFLYKANTENKSLEYYIDRLLYIAINHVAYNS